MPCELSAPDEDEPHEMLELQVHRDAGNGITEMSQN